MVKRDIEFVAIDCGYRAHTEFLMKHALIDRVRAGFGPLYYIALPFKCRGLGA